MGNNVFPSSKPHFLKLWTPIMPNTTKTPEQSCSTMKFWSRVALGWSRAMPNTPLILCRHVKLWSLKTCKNTYNKNITFINNLIWCANTVFKQNHIGYALKWLRFSPSCSLSLLIMVAHAHHNFNPELPYGERSTMIFWMSNFINIWHTSQNFNPELPYGENKYNYFLNIQFH